MATEKPSIPAVWTMYGAFMLEMPKSEAAIHIQPHLSALFRGEDTENFTEGDGS